MADSRSWKSASLFAASLLLSACATTRYTESRIAAVPPQVKGRPGAPSVEVDGLRLRIEPLDRAPQQKGVPPLSLRLVFEPRELGYSFDPGQVLLRTADGREWRSAGGEYRPLHPNARFVLAFDAPVTGEAPVDLVLGGLARGPRRLDPVTFRLSRRAGRSIDRMYWLEALGYVLLAPVAVVGTGAAAY